MERLAFTYIGGPGGQPPRAETRPSGAVSGPAPVADTLAYLSLLAFTLVLLVRPQDQIAAVAPLHLAELFGGAAVVSLAIGRLTRGLPIVRLSPELVGVIAFAAVIVGTVPLSFWPGGSMALFTNTFLKVLLVAAVIGTTVTTRARFEMFTGVVLFSTTYVAARAIIDYTRGVNLIEDGRVRGVVGGLFGNPNDMALTMVTFLPIAIGLALVRGRWYLRALGLVAIPALTGAIVVSKSRGGFVGLAVMMIVALYHLRNLRPAVAALLLAAGLLAVPMLPSSFLERMSSIVDANRDATGSREARKTLLREGFRTFLENPFTGVGAGQFPNYNPAHREETWRQTHNALLQVAAELGIVGLAVFLYMIATGFGAGLFALRAVRRSRRRPRSAPTGPSASVTSPPPAPVDRETLDWLEITAGMIIAALTGWLVSSMFASVAYYWTLYIMLAMASALRLITQDTFGAAAAPTRAVSAARGARC